MKKRGIFKFTTWVHLFNTIILFIVYGILNKYGAVIAPLIGLWSIFQLAYRIFWQFLGLDKIYKNATSYKSDKNK